MRSGKAKERARPGTICYQCTKVEICDLRPKYEQLYNEGKITKAQRHALFSDEVNQIFSERYGLEYGRDFFE